MAVRRTEIEAALDDLISHVEGMRFQSLAVILAKRRWPQLVASEWMHDHGLDAHARGELFEDGVEKGLACSITATLAKIKEDLKKATVRFPELKVLLFATPRKVPKPTEEKWREEIPEEFGVSLNVLPREDVISELQKPESAELCESHLRIPLAPRDPTDEQLFEAAQAATGTAEENWSRHLSGLPLIGLGMQRAGESQISAPEILGLNDLNGYLRTGRRIVLEAPAGRGKTTSLIQLSRMVSSSGALPFLVDLLAWIGQNVSMLDFIAGMPGFRARGVTASKLAEMQGRTQFVFLLNGWNELASAESLSASRRLRELDLDFPSAGIVVATRAHPVKPPIQGGEVVQLLPLSRKQRSDYLRARFGAKSPELESTLENDAVLDEMTRTPLILSYVGSLFAAGRAIPATKTAVLSALADLLENEAQHATALSEAPLNGFARVYLEDIACDLTARGTTQLGGQEARQLVRSTSKRLQDTGQIAALPEPGAILRELTAHHILDITAYPSETLSFIHQQFQELFASQRLVRILHEALGDTEGLKACTRTFFNEPAWEEPVLMAAEQLRESAEDAAAEAGAAMALETLKLDPVFASELSVRGRCKDVLWIF